MKELEPQKEYKNLIRDIGLILAKARNQAYKSANTILLKTYWKIGKRIVEFEQGGKEKAEYGKQLLIDLSKDLKLNLGKGFSRSNLQYMRLFYTWYPNLPDASGKLKWSHYVELLGVTDNLTRSFYEKQCTKENWSIRELNRQINSMLFERIALSKDKKEVLEISKAGQVIKTAKDVIKEPYILEFLGIPENHKYSEKELEQKILDNLKMFLLELGKGFAFVKSQFRMTLDNEHYYVDLVFYHRILKCFVLIDLKIRKVKHFDIGQMNMYLNYFKTEENFKDDNEPIGIILAASKNDIVVEYALGGITNNFLFQNINFICQKKKS